MSSSKMESSEEILCVNQIRCLAAALPTNANSGHPGGPMGCAVMAHVLFSHIMKYTSKNPMWIARDRFVLSNGHACALQYTMLYLTGYNISLDDLKKFRQLHSILPGHPERHLSLGIEVTTGPLGQGISQSVGLAIALQAYTERFNKKDIQLFDSFVYCIVGDGCLQEGVSSEASSLAGHLGLGRLIVLYDSNNITIDGHTDLSCTDDVELRYKSYHWQVIKVDDASKDITSLKNAIKQAQQNLEQPTMIICSTIIGYGSSVENSEKAHGAPLKLDDLKQCRKKFKLEDTDNIFDVDKRVSSYYKKVKDTKEKQYVEWENLFHTTYKQKYPDFYEELIIRPKQYDGNSYEEKIQLIKPFDSIVQKIMKTDCVSEQQSETKKILDELYKYFLKFDHLSTPDSTRALSGKILNCIDNHLLYKSILMGGSADLSTSTCSSIKNSTLFSKQSRSGRNICFGVREHSMIAITNGIQAFGGFKPFCATFLNFITYGWGAVRLSCLSELPVLFLMTHDSIELGEDGPTHQPIEVAALCRATPNLYYFRPADGKEVIAGYLLWLQSIKTPVILALSRSGTPHLEKTCILQAMKKGGYVIKDFQTEAKKSLDKIKIILGGSGTEVAVCMEASKKLEQSHFDVRVLSIPCWNILKQQPDSYIKSLFVQDQSAFKLYVETANVLQYKEYFDDCIHMTGFGASAPKKDLMKHFGFTPDHIYEKIISKFSK